MRESMTPGSPAWRAAEASRLLDFASGSALQGGGFGWLDDDGRVDTSRPRELWITARMTHVFGLAAMTGHSGAADLAAHGVQALATIFADEEHGGWIRSVDDMGQPLDDVKANYDHCFVLLASSTAVAAGLPGAAEVLARAQATVENHFWSELDGLSLESFTRDWSVCEDYRGVNSNMHAVESFTACGDVSSDPVWRERALRIAKTVIDGFARAHRWRLPEHYDPHWQPLLDYNTDQRRDPFRPYGSTPGHWLEWSRLLIGLHSALGTPPTWLLESAAELFHAAARVAWAADGKPGFVYTLDWNDRTVVSERLHWVAAEAVLAADALHRATGDQRAAALLERWWRHIDDWFCDTECGSWHHELDSDLRVSRLVWSGKPDVYHAYQAVTLPDLPLAPAAAAALAAGPPQRVG